MSIRVPQNPKIYHIVHKQNLKSIIDSQYLYSDSEISNLENPSVKIGMSKIKLRRLTEIKLRTYPDIYVGECVPFYFCYRSVMLYMLHMGNHQEITYTGGQQPIIHLVFDLNKVVEWANANECRWLFTLSNAGSYYFEEKNSLDNLDELNWNVIQSNYWTSDRDGKQAEFLLEKKLPFELIEKIGVINNEVKLEILEILNDSEHKPDVEIETSWYY